MAVNYNPLFPEDIDWGRLNFKQPIMSQGPGAQDQYPTGGGWTPGTYEAEEYDADLDQEAGHSAPAGPDGPLGPGGPDQSNAHLFSNQAGADMPEHMSAYEAWKRKRFETGEGGRANWLRKHYAQQGNPANPHPMINQITARMDKALTPSARKLKPSGVYTLQKPIAP